MYRDFAAVLGIAGLWHTKHVVAGNLISADGGSAERQNPRMDRRIGVGTDPNDVHRSHHPCRAASQARTE